MFIRATKHQAKGRMALCGPSGSGKTFTSLRIAKALQSGGNGRIALGDTESGSASKYAKEFDFDVDIMTDFSPASYIKVIRAAEKAQYPVLILDSLTHAWDGKGGVLEMHDQASKRSRSQNTYFAWGEVTPEHKALIAAMVGSSCHIIATMRTQTEYLIETENGKQKPVKIGTKPIQRKGMEYEFDVVCDLDLETNCFVSKTRCSELKGKTFHEAGEDDLGKVFHDWLTDGAPALFGDAERHRLKDAVEARLLELGMSLGETNDVGRSIVQALGYEDSKQVPVEKLSEALELIGKWEGGS